MSILVILFSFLLSFSLLFFFKWASYYIFRIERSNFIELLSCSLIPTIPSLKLISSQNFIIFPCFLLLRAFLIKIVEMIFFFFMLFEKQTWWSTFFHILKQCTKEKKICLLVYLIIPWNRNWWKLYWSQITETVS